MSEQLKPATEERAAALKEISSEWKEVEGRDAIKRTFMFDNFDVAWVWMNKVFFFFFFFFLFFFFFFFFLIIFSSNNFFL